MPQQKRLIVAPSAITPISAPKPLVVSVADITPIAPEPPTIPEAALLPGFQPSTPTGGPMAPMRPRASHAPTIDPIQPMPSHAPTALAPPPKPRPRPLPTLEPAPMRPIPSHEDDFDLLPSHRVIPPATDGPKVGPTPRNVLDIAENAIRSTGAGALRFNTGFWGLLQAAGDVLGMPSLSEWSAGAAADAERIGGEVRGLQQGAGWKEKAAYSGFESMGLSIPALLAGFATGSPGTTLGIMGGATGGEAYATARKADKTDEKALGLWDPDVPKALAYAVSQGAVEVATERIPVKVFFRDLLGNAPVMQMIYKQLAAEVPTEQIATVLQDLNEWAELNPEKPFKEYLAERPSAAGQTLIATIVGTLGQTAGVATAQKVSEYLATQTPADSQDGAGIYTAPPESASRPVDGTLTVEPSEVTPLPRGPQSSPEPEPVAVARTPSLGVRIGNSSDVRAIASHEQAGQFADYLRDQLEESGEGGNSNWPGVDIVDTQTGDVVGHVSYNGRIWEGSSREWKSGVTKEIERPDGRGYGKAPAITVTQETQEERNARMRAEAAAEPPVKETKDLKALKAAEEMLVRDRETKGEPIVVTPEEVTPVKTHKFSSTQVNLPPEVSAKLQAFGQRIPDEDLAADGRETESHITVKYGLTTTDAEEVRKVLATEKPITVTFGKTSHFADVEDGTADAVLVEIESPDLERLNKKIAEALDTPGDTHPTYKPHATIAYVQPGKGKDYDGDETLKGETMTLDRIVFSGKDGNTVEIPLAGEGTAGVALKTGQGQTISPDGTQSDEGEGTGPEGRPSVRRIAASLPPHSNESRKQQTERRERHYRDVYKTVLASAKTLDPEVNPRELRKEFETRIGILEELDRDFVDSGHTPRELLEAIRNAGGISIEAEHGGGMTGELRWLREGDALGPYGTFGGVPHVFRKREKLAGEGKRQSGLGLDEMVTRLNQQSKFSHIKDQNDLLAALEDVARMGDVGARGVAFPGTDELASRAGMKAGEKWWEDSWQQQESGTEPQPLTAESYQAAFGGTKEQAEAIVRVFEAMGIPLDRVQVAKGGPTGELTQGARDLSQDALAVWVTDLKARVGRDLEVLDLRLLPSGNLHLETIAVRKGAEGRGVGARVMDALTDFADRYGRTIELGLADKGYQPVEGGVKTTSRGRLRTFYRRFGFIDNRGRAKDFRMSIYTSMYRSPRPYVRGRRPTASEAFRAWFGNSQVVDADGQPLVVYHGTNRLDRFGPTLRKSRATSGPMPFFTASQEIASRYALDKPDTSLANEDVHNYEAWFRLKAPRVKDGVHLNRAWYFLTPEQRTRIAALAPRVTTEDDQIVLGPEGHDSGTGGYDQHIKEARGNHFAALIEEWLNSATLFNDEKAFLRVLELAGAPVADITYHDPGAELPGVVPVYLSIQNPLVTDKIPDTVMTRLENRARRVRRRPQESGADPWAKERRDAREWLSQLKEDYAKRENSFVWSSIPDWVTEELQSLGYDGIRDTGGKMGGAAHVVWIPFAPPQVKSAIGNRGTFDPHSANILYQDATEPSPIFYSRLNQVLTEKMPKRATAKQVLDIVSNPKNGVKAEEVQWSGLKTWLAGQEAVEKADVIAFLGANQIQIKEVLLGAHGELNVDAEMAIIRAEGFDVTTDGDITDEPYLEWNNEPVEMADDGAWIDGPRPFVPRRVREAFRRVQAKDDAFTHGRTKYEQYTLPGGTEYRELLLALPLPSRYEARKAVFAAYQPQLTAIDNEITARLYGQKPREGLDALQAERDRLETQRDAEADAAGGEASTEDQFRASHWDDVPNILASIRFNERTDAQGRRVLFVEEVQSDWHQKGRREGYQLRNVAEKEAADRRAAETRGALLERIREIDPDAAPDGTAAIDMLRRHFTGRSLMLSLTPEMEASLRPAFDAHMEALHQQERARAGEKTGVPDAPFKTTWPELAMKRMLRYAAEHGYEVLAWTTGEQQNARYDLSKQVKSIVWVPVVDGSANATAGATKVLRIDPQSGPVIRLAINAAGVVQEDAHASFERVNEPFVGKPLVDVVGKDIADQILGNDKGDLRDSGLKLGGSGMKGFYDQILPRFMDKYGKGWGVHTHDVSIQVEEQKRGTTRYEGPDVPLAEVYDRAIRAAHGGNEGLDHGLTSIAHRMERGDTLQEIADNIINNPNWSDIEVADAMHALGWKEVDTPPVHATAKVHGVLVTDAARQSVIKGQPLFQGPRASVEFTQQGDAIIRALENPNVSSGLHEAAHVARRFLFDRSLPHEVREGISDDDILTAEDWAGAKDGVWDRAAEEKFARGFERYVYDGKAPSESLTDLFEKFARWLAKVYRTLAGSPIDVEISPAMREVFDRLVTRTERLQKAEAEGDISFDVDALESDLDTLYQDDASPEYRAALEASRKASQAFTEAQRQYRAKEIGDAEYLAARQAYNESEKAFDKAYAAEERRPKKKATAPRTADLFDTGEEQPRLPGAEDVREQEIKTPEFELPFSLTSEVSKGKKGKQSTLFQDDGTPKVTRRRRDQKEVTLEELAMVARRRKASLEAVRKVAEENGYTVVDEAPRPVQTEGTRPIPSTGRIPPERIHEFPSLQKMPREVRPDIQAMLEQYGGFEPQRRGVQSWDRTQALAKEMWLPLETLRAGTALNAEEMEAYKTAIATALMKRKPLLEKIKDGTATDWEKLEASHLTDVATMLTASYRGAKAEAGRALNILRAKARVIDLRESRFLEMALQAPGFSADITTLSKEALDAAGDPLAQLRLLRRRTGTMFDKLLAIYYGNLLSGLKTQLRNIIGNSFNAAANLATPIGAVPMDMWRVRRKGGQREVYLGEIPHAIMGTVIGMHAGLRNAAFTFRHGFRPSTVEAAEQGVFDQPRVELAGGLLNPWNIPGRALEAADEWFRALAHHQELHAAFYAQARKDGATTPTQIRDRMAVLMAETDLTRPDGKLARKILNEVAAFEARAVFQEPAGHVVRTLMKLKGVGAPKPVRLFATFLMPFMRISGAITRQGFEWTPVGFRMRGAKGEMGKGRPQAQAQGRALLGTLALAPIAWMAASAMLTGAPPEDEGEREEFYAMGKLGNAIKVGKYWVRYILFQPFSVPLSAVANAWELWRQSKQDEAAAQEAFAAAVAGAGASILDQSFLSGLSTFIDATESPLKDAGRWLTLFVQGFVPLSGLMRNVTQAVDPVVRKPEGVVESWKSIIPGLSQTVPARRDRFGEAVTRPGGPVRRGFLVPEVSKEQTDELTRVIAEVGYQPVRSRPTLTRAGESVPLTKEQEDLLAEALGRERKAALEGVIRVSDFARQPDEIKRERLERASASATSGVRSRALRTLNRKEEFTLERLLSSRAMEAVRQEREGFFGRSEERARVGR